MSKKQNAYLGIDSWIVNLILAIIPLTSWILGIVTRFQRGQILWGLVQLISAFFFGLGILFFWIIDLVSMILHKDLKYLA